MEVVVEGKSFYFDRFDSKRSISPRNNTIKKKAQEKMRVSTGSKKSEKKKL